MTRKFNIFVERSESFSSEFINFLSKIKLVTKVKVRLNSITIFNFLGLILNLYMYLKKNNNKIKILN